MSEPEARPSRAARETFLKFSPPLIGEEEINEVVDTLRSDWITTGPKTAQFEEEFRTYINAPGALALNSCTAGLHVALAASGIGPGDEVITTAMTFAASVNVIEHVGARPVLVDVEADTLNLDPLAVEQAITPNTRAIIAVHFAGHPVDLDPIRDIADRHDVVLIEDAAHALPASYRGVRIGATPNPAAFSFYATKNLTTGEGGMLTGSPELLEEARCLALHGMNRDAWKRYDAGGSWYYEVVAPGFKYNMTDIQASLGIWQLRKLESFQERRRSIASSYTSAFQHLDAFETPANRPEVEHAWHLYVLRLRPDALSIGRDEFIRELTRRKIGTSVHFIPVHVHPFYRDKYAFEPGSLPTAMDSYSRMLSLPINPRMSDEDAADVIEALLDIAANHGR